MWIFAIENCLYKYATNLHLQFRLITF
jgi:hypothetical protein